MWSRGDWISMRAYINPATQLIEFPPALRLRSGDLIRNPLAKLLDSSEPPSKVDLPSKVRRKVDLHAYFNVKTQTIKCRTWLQVQENYIANPLRDLCPLRQDPTNSGPQGS